MADNDLVGGGHPHRKQTDDSLRAEREEADAGGIEKAALVEEQADEVVRIARQKADEIVQAARNAADRDRDKDATARAASSEERARADTVLGNERADEDAILQLHRAERKRYLADFLAREREATDNDLIGERAHADTVIDARDQFLATVSHDLRSLLGGLALNAGLLVAHAPQGSGGDNMRRHAATSQRLVGRMNRLVNDLLDIASIEAGKLSIVEEEIEVAKIVHDIMDAFNPIAKAKGVTLHGDDIPPQLCVHMDGGRVLQVLAKSGEQCHQVHSARG